MASLNQVGIEFITQGEKNMISALGRVDQAQQKLERSSKGLEAAIKRGIATEEQAVVAYLALTKSGIEYQSVLKGLEQNSKMLGAAHQSNINGLLGVDRASKSARDSASALSDAFKEQERVAAQNQKTARAFGQLVAEVNTYATANKSAEASAEIFAKQIERVEQSNLRAAQSFGDSVREANNYTTANKSAEASAEVFARQLDRVEQANLEVARSFGESVRAVQQVNLANKSAETSAQMFSQEIERLTAKFNPLYAASKRYEMQLDELNRAHMLGALNSKQHEAALEQLNLEFARGGTSVSGLAKANQHASRKINEVGMATQQVGYQVGDFLVQIQSGTNAFVAFGQQATQLVGILPMFASKLGVSVGTLIGISSVLGIAIPLITAIGAAFMRTGQQAEEAADSIKNYRTEVENLRLGISSQEREYVDAITSQKVALEEAVEQLRLRQEIVSKQGEDVEYFSRREREAVDTAREALELAKARYEEFLRLRQESERLKDIQDLTNQELQVGASLASDFSDEAEKIRKAYEELSDEIGDAATQALILAGVDITSGVDDAAKAAAVLASQLGIALGFAKSIQAIGVAGAYSETVPGAGRFGPAGPAGLLPPGGVPGATTDSLIPISPRTRPSMRPMDLGVTTGTSGGGAGAAQTQENYLQKLQEEAELKLRMIGLSEEEQRYQEIVNELKERELPIEEERIQQIINTEEALRQATDAETRRQDLMQTVNSSIEQSLMSLIDGSKSVEDAMTGMIRAILQEIAMQAIVRPIASGITGALFGGFADGAAFRSGNVIPFANGGVVGSPTMFPMAGNQTGLMGEAGPEAIMPLKRGKGGKLGVVAEGASQPVVIHQNFNFSANGDDSVKRIIAQEAPKIANLTQKQILDQRSRGGVFKTTFG